MNYNTFTYTLNRSQFAIRYEKSGNFVNTGRFRPDKYFATPPVGGRFLALTDECEFTEDLNLQIKFLKYAVEEQGQDILGTTIVSALMVACENHITKYGRLIDTDLYTYIDINFHIVKTMSQMSDDELKSVYGGLVEEFTNMFRDSIYVSDPIIGLKKLI